MAPVNDAPALGNAGAAFTIATTDEKTASALASVDSILTSAGYSDAADCCDARGLAVVGTNGAGTWQYNAGSSWVAFTASGGSLLSPSSALLLSSPTQVRYVPLAYGPPETATFALAGWDRTNGTLASTSSTRSIVDLSTYGPAGLGASPFSADIAFARVQVVPSATPSPSASISNGLSASVSCLAYQCR